MNKSYTYQTLSIIVAYLAKPQWYLRSPNRNTSSLNSSTSIIWACVAYPAANGSCMTKSASSHQWVPLSELVLRWWNVDWDGMLLNVYRLTIPPTVENFRMQYSCMCDNGVHQPTCLAREFVFQSMCS